MNCAECQESLVGYIEGVLGKSGAQAVASHLQDCPACRAEADEHARLRYRLTRDGRALAQEPLDARVMRRIPREATFRSRRIAMRRRYGTAGLGLVAAAAAAMVLFAVWPGSGTRDVSAAEVIRQGIEALKDIRSVYIKANMRTLPHEVFEFIGLNCDFVPIEMWKRFDDPPQWRVEKPGRVVVMDGKSSLLFIKGCKVAAKGGIHSGFVQWPKDLLNVNEVLDSEIRQAQEQGSELWLTRETGVDGRAVLEVTIEAKAQGDLSNDWLKDKSICASDNRRVYRFDADTRLLEDLQVYVHVAQRDVLVLEIAEIQYNPVTDPGLFKLALPEDVVWYEQPRVLEDNEAYAQMSPEQVARAFFQACADEDWDEVLKFWPMSSVDEWFKAYLGGVEIISIGQPFKSGLFAGRFVPYEIKLRSGRIKKFNLAVRNDNPAKRYVVCGGI